jgi:hypothetical protein
MPAVDQDPIPPQVAIAIARTTELSAWFAEHLPREITYTARNALGMAYFGLAIEHHVAIALLIEQGRYSSAYALVRPLYEAALRGYWVAFVARDADVVELQRHTPSFDRIIRELNAGSPIFEAKQFAGVHALGWKSFCDYTHGGSRQLSRWLAGDSIGQGHPPEEIASVLGMANQLACLAAGGAIQLAGGDLTPLHDLLQPRPAVGGGAG